VEDFCDKTFPRRDIVRRCSALHSDHDFIRARSFRGRDSRGIPNRQKEKQSQKSEEAKSIEGPSRQTHSKACVEILGEVHKTVIPSEARNLSFVRTQEKRDSSLCSELQRGIVFPQTVEPQGSRTAKTKTGNLAAPRFSAFDFRRRCAD
jgi:hypothetical protein